MPNIKSAIKRVKVAEKKTLNNNMLKSEYKTAVKKYETANANGDKSATELLSVAKSELDHACTRGVISKNAASRKKSRLEKKLAVKVETKKAPVKKVEKVEATETESKVTEAPKAKTTKTTAKKATTAKKTTTKKATKKSE